MYVCCVIYVVHCTYNETSILNKNYWNYILPNRDNLDNVLFFWVFLRNKCSTQFVKLKIFEVGVLWLILPFWYS